MHVHVKNRHLLPASAHNPLMTARAHEAEQRLDSLRMLSQGAEDEVCTKHSACVDFDRPEQFPKGVGVARREPEAHEHDDVRCLESVLPQAPKLAQPLRLILLGGTRRRDRQLFVGTSQCEPLFTDADDNAALSGLLLPIHAAMQLEHGRTRGPDSGVVGLTWCHDVNVARAAGASDGCVVLRLVKSFDDPVVVERHDRIVRGQTESPLPERLPVLADRVGAFKERAALGGDEAAGGCTKSCRRNVLAAERFRARSAARARSACGLGAAGTVAEGRWWAQTYLGGGVNVIDEVLCVRPHQLAALGRRRRRVDVRP